jgi:hypothetical protein
MNPEPASAGDTKTDDLGSKRDVVHWRRDLSRAAFS